MGENKMRELFINTTAEVFFPKKSGNSGTFASVNSKHWERKFYKFLQKIISKTFRKNKRFCYTVITPNAYVGQETHYLSLIIDVESRYMHTFDPLLRSDEFAPWRNLESVLSKFATDNFYYYEYVTQIVPWQNEDDDSWCQTWSLLYQNEHSKSMNEVSKAENNEVAAELEEAELAEAESNEAEAESKAACECVDICECKRKQLIKFIKTVGPPDFEQELQREFEARTGIKYSARQLITDATYDHFFNLLD
jgi:hypothetical protein